MGFDRGRKKKRLLWTPEDDEALAVMFCEKKPVFVIAKKLDRTSGAVRARIIKLELPDIYDIDAY